MNEALADRLIGSLHSGAGAGGDRRGIKSAATKFWLDREYASVDARGDGSETQLYALKEILSQQRSAS